MHIPTTLLLALLATLTSSHALPQTPSPSTSPQCTIGGCNRELCSKTSSSDDDGGLFSPCIYKPEFACYANAACVYDVAGDECIWDESRGLRRCIDSARGEGVSSTMGASTTAGTETATAAHAATTLAATPPPRCRRAGCNAEFCIPATAPDVRSTCVWRPVFACYKFTECGWDEGSGRCVFEENRRLRMCLRAAKGDGGLDGSASSL
ncbi:uncharacterized protein EV422DRAFT_563416 [Fimicolochytrium jonesii]|uniref:uncharacterized protein n=1 Tax=Fimicolochytrium jonesii TaxID=1396493 RepID=UPI0022FF0F59|nr:uncharacterized protein EV422DRAFT_563416 [Fimicolochytrium jonesii]KAI8825585.1 hypothetical protein EV422DRAFT_563416 [Fimicolochytrium jonesii]